MQATSPLTKIQDHDGVIWPIDTFKGFYALGYGIVFSLFAAIVINGAFSYPTLSGYLPDPLFRIYMRNIHKDKHGSDSGTYDNEGRFVPQKFEDIFSKYAEGRDYVTVRDVLRFLRGQRLIADPFGWFGALFECKSGPRSEADGRRGRMTDVLVEPQGSQRTSCSGPPTGAWPRRTFAESMTAASSTPLPPGSSSGRIDADGRAREGFGRRLSRGLYPLLILEEFERTIRSPLRKVLLLRNSLSAQVSHLPRASSMHWPA